MIDAAGTLRRLAATALLALGSGAPTALAAQPTRPHAAVRAVGSDTAARAEADPSPPLSPAEIARRALPAVVEVVTYGPAGDKLGGGSGFIVSPEGLVVTSHHVLEGAKRARVVLADGDEFEVRHVSGADARRDLVVLRIAGFDLPSLALGDSREVEVGDRVVVIGSPLGLASTVSDGLLSAKREMEGRRVLQLSAPISKGSSGGPVFDDRGRVVGVLAGFLRKGQNVNFAVPVEYARGLLELPPGMFSVESAGRKRVALLGGPGASSHGLSLQAVLRGEKVPGEEETPWALQPRRIDPERVRRNPAGGADALAGLWELRELSRVPGIRSGLYRGVLASDGSLLRGRFFGSLVAHPDVDAAFEGERVRGFELALGPAGRATLEGEHGCSYFVHASAEGMAGVYECTGADGDVYDLGAVELRRIEGEGPSGTWAFREETPLGEGVGTGRGRVLVYAVADGRWVGALVATGPGGPTVRPLEEGRWTADGHLSARLGPDGPRVRGSFAAGRLALDYPVGGEEYPVRARLTGERVSALAVDAGDVRPEERPAAAPEP